MNLTPQRTLGLPFPTAGEVAHWQLEVVNAGQGRRVRRSHSSSDAVMMQPMQLDCML